MRRAAVLVLALTALAVPAAASAQACPKTTLGDIEDEVMCVVCGTPLGLSTEAPQAQRERAFIEGLIADCRSKPEIKRALVAQFGDRVLALPGDAGSKHDLRDTLVYVIPALVALLAVGTIALALLRWRGRRPGRQQTPPLGAESGHLESDMERYDL
jgi:cytochrome c-type biogenesis protein CcmH